MEDLLTTAPSSPSAAPNRQLQLSSPDDIVANYGTTATDGSPSRYWLPQPPLVPQQPVAPHVTFFSPSTFGSPSIHPANIGTPVQQTANVVSLLSQHRQLGGC